MSEVFLGLACALASLAIFLGIPIFSIVSGLRASRRIAAAEARIATLEETVARLRASAARSTVPAAEPVAGRVQVSAPPMTSAPRTGVSAEPAPRAEGAAPPTDVAPSPHVAPSPDVPPSPDVAPSPPPTAAASPPSDAAPAPPVDVAPSEAPPEAAPPPRPPPTTGPPPRPTPPPPPPAPPFRLPGVETLAVWLAASLGGLGLVAAALLGLALAIERGYVGPPVRFLLAIGAGVGCWFGAELLRVRAYRVPAAALAGAGAAVLYGGLFAGHARYGLIGQPVAMGAMVAVTVVTMFTAVRQGNVLLALLATGGGFLTPILLSTGENKAVAFFTYLALLDAGVIAAAVRRRWWPVVGFAGLVTTALHVGWGLRFRAPDQVPVALIASLGIGLLFLLLVFRRSVRRPEALAGGLSALGLGLAGIAFLVPADPLMSDPVSGLPLRWSLGATATMAAVWVPALAGVYGVAVARRGEAVLRLGVGVLVALAMAVFVVSWVAAGVREVPWVGVVAVLVVVPPIVAAVTHRYGGRAFEAAGLLVLSGLLGTFVVAIGGAEQGPGWDGVVPGVAPSNPLLVALVVGLTAASVGIGRLPGLRGALPVGLVAAALPLYPGLEARVGELGGGLLFGAAALVYAAHVFPPLLRPRKDDLAGALVASAAGPVLFWPFLVLWESALGDELSGVVALLLAVPTLIGALGLVRTLRARPDSRELALFVVVTLFFAALAVPLQLDEAWLTVGWAIEMALLAWVSRRVTHGGVRVGVGVLAVAVAVRLLVNEEALAYGGGEGWILLNWTLYTWGVPGVCLLLAARWLPSPAWAPRALRITAVLVFFALVNLEVAHAFARDDVLSFTSENLAESMTRSISWGAFGLVILVVGFVSGSRVARLGGFAFALLGAAKVCLVDVWNLSGLVRVGSFFGLAVVLMLAALVFQSVVLRERER